MSEDDTVKQQLCYDEIICKNYDPNEFVTYMRTQKHNGDNVDYWTLEELSDQIKKFQILSERGGLTKPADELVRRDSTNMEQSLKVGFLLDDFEIKEQHKMKQCDTTKYWFDGYLNIKVGCFKKEAQMFEEFFGRTYMFSIQSSPVRWRVNRSLQDFYLLRCILNKQYPNLFIPYISNEYPKSEEEAQILSQQMERFLNYLSSQKLLQSNIYGMYFLQEVNDYMLSSVLDNANKITKNYSLKFTTQDGILDLSLDQNTLDEARYYLEYSTKMDHSRLLEEFKTQKSLIQQLSESLSRSRRIVEQLADQTSQQIQTQLKINYQRLSYYIIALEDLFGQDKLLVNHDIQKYFEDFQNDQPSLKTMRSNLKEVFVRLRDYDLALKQRKETLFQQKDISKWELDEDEVYEEQQLLDDKELAFKVMCRSGNDHLEEMKDIVCLFLRSYKEQMAQYCEQKQIDSREIFETLIDEQLEIMRDTYILCKHTNKIMDLVQAREEIQ